MSTIEMDHKTSIWLFDGHGGVSQIEHLKHVPHGQFAWVQLSPDAIKDYLKMQSDVPPMVEAIMAMATMRLRVLAADDHFVTVLRGITADSKAALKINYDLIRFWLHERVVVTVQASESFVVNLIESVIQKGQAPKNSAEFFEWVVFSLTESSAKTVKVVSTALNRIEDKVAAGKTPAPAQIKYLTLLRQRLIAIRRYLKPQREVMTLLLDQKLKWMTKTQSLHLRAVVDANMRLVDDIEMANDQAAVLSDQLTALSHEDTDKKIFILTLVAAVFMPISFLTGLLGVNLGGIPGAKSHVGFLVFCGILLAVFLGQYVLFKWRKWF